MDTALRQFIETLEDSLERRFNDCQDFAATPSAILHEVLNAVAEAREAAEKAHGPFGLGPKVPGV